MTAMTAATLDQLSDGRMLLGHRLVRAAGQRGLARRALRQPARAHARVHRGRAQGAGARAAGVPRRAPRAAAARRAGQGAEADDRARAGADPDLPGGDRAEEHARWPARSPTAGSPRSSSPEHLPELRESLEEGAARAGRSLDDFDIAPTVNVMVTDDQSRRARRDAAVRRAVRRRHGLARAELLQRADAPLRVRGRGREGPGPLPGGQEGRGRGGAARRVPRPGRADRPARRGARAAARLPRRGRRHARPHAAGVRQGAAGSSSCGASPSSSRRSRSSRGSCSGRSATPGTRSR